jgi:hypothetical protein
MTVHDLQALEDQPFRRAGLEALPGHGAGVMVETSEGAQPVEWLRAGDLLLTRDNGYQPLLWVGRTLWGAEHALPPVRICSGSLDPQTPKHDLILSPAHNILLNSHLVDFHFGHRNVLAPACDLITQTENTQALPKSDYVYCHLLLPQHNVVLTEGIWTETLFADDVTLERLGPEAARQIRSKLTDQHMASQTCHMVLDVGEACVLQPRIAIAKHKMAA